MASDPPTDPPTESTAAKPSLNFVWGKPAPTLLPVPQLSNSVESVLGNSAAATDALEYGDTAGPAALRHHVAQSLSDFYGTPNSAEEICITAGSSQGLATILQVLTDPLRTKRVWLVAPVFHLACRVFEDAGFTGKLRAVPETDTGIDLDSLERALVKLELDESELPLPPPPATKPADPARKSYTHLVYIVPSFSNPTGRTVPLSQRHRLVELARRFDALIICDDIYDYLSYSSGSAGSDASSLLPRIVDIDRTLPVLPTDPLGFGHVLSNGSFSKLIGPGVRTGWVSASPAIATALANAGASVAGGCPSQFGSAIVAQFMAAGHLTPHVRDELIPTYARRRRLMGDAVEKFLYPLGARIVGDAEGRVGGFYIWLKLPDGLDGGLVALRCLEREALAVWPGKAFEVVGDASVDFTPYLRLCFTWEKEEYLAEGIQRLARIVQGVLDEDGQGDLAGKGETWRETLWKSNTTYTLKSH